MWPSILHDVALAAERGLALVAAEVLHVPVPALCLGAFISKDYLHDPDITLISKDIVHGDLMELNQGHELMSNDSFLYGFKPVLNPTCNDNI